MGLLDLLPTSNLGWKGQKPPFNAETPNSTLHDTSSVNDIPPITRNPSQLDEGDPTNTSKYRNATGKKYTDNLPR